MEWLIKLLVVLTPAAMAAQGVSTPASATPTSGTPTSGTPTSGTPKPLPPLTRGVFQDWAGSKTSGTFQFQTPDEQKHVCAFSPRTYFELDHKRAFITTLQTGNTVEVLSERTAEPPLCRALIVRVVLENTTLRVRRPFSPPTEPILPRGNLLFTGIVVRTDDNAFLLRTRGGQSHWIQLRKDTRFGAEGLAVQREDLPMNRPVQIRAGRSFENAIEAYSIVWGEILKPR
ncbi:MAG: hypothetical protein JNL98_23605 [Bryobacterales bacterium]|nr:hypothetical protein [Bryobacterales bacterium]